MADCDRFPFCLCPFSFCPTQERAWARQQLPPTRSRNKNEAAAELKRQLARGMRFVCSSLQRGGGPAHHAPHEAWGGGGFLFCAGQRGPRGSCQRVVPRGRARFDAQGATLVRGAPARGFPAWPEHGGRRLSAAICHVRARPREPALQCGRFFFPSTRRKPPWTSLRMTLVMYPCSRCSWRRRRCV